MPTEIRVVGALGPDGLNFANLLPTSLGAAVVLVDESGKAAVLSGAEHVLGWKGDPGVEGLPAPLLRLAREATELGEPIGNRMVEISGLRTPTVLLRAAAVPLNLGSGGPKVVLVLNDLSSIGRFEEHVLQLDRLATLGTLAAGMAHEVKNALVACKTFIDLLLEKNQDGELVDIVRREVSRIDSIVTRTLRFAGRRGRDLTALHVHEILDHCLRVVEHPMEEKAIGSIRSLDAASDLIQGDEHELQQAFVNLLLNAVEAMGPKGNLRVSTELRPSKAQAASMSASGESRQLWISIEDTGTGIPPEVMTHLFEPFVTTKPSGTGLGLAITKRIVQQHRGTITAKSHLGQGTTFTILLPAIEPAQAQG